MDGDGKELNCHPGTTVSCNLTANDILAVSYNRKAIPTQIFNDRYRASREALSFLKRGTEELQQAKFIRRETALKIKAVTCLILQHFLM